MPRHLVVIALVGLCLLAQPAMAQVRAAGIDTISPGAARKGELVTITGHGFGARNVRVTVGGVRARVVAATGSQVTFRVPDGVAPGRTQVTAINPGSQSGSIGFRMLEGILLPGNPAALLKDANFDLLGLGVDAAQIQNGIFLTRLGVRFTPNATVGQVNNALKEIDGGIVAMARGFTSVTIAIPRQQMIEDLEALVALLESLPGVRLAKVIQSPQTNQIFTPADLDSVALYRHLLPGRFPAAWNTLPRGISSDSGLCPVPPIPVLVADFFGATAPAGFSAAVPAFSPPASPPSGFDEDHGYNVSLTLAADEVGANPFINTGCVDLRLIQQAGLPPDVATDYIVASMPAGKFIINRSLGFQGRCLDAGPGDPLDPGSGSPCVPPHDILAAPKPRADGALYWKERTQSRWPDFLMVVAGGNERAQESAVIYGGMDDSRFISEASISQLPDTLFNFVSDNSLWTPAPPFVTAGFESLASNASDISQAVEDAGMNDAIADNVIVVGSATTQSKDTTLTQHVTGDQLAESSFSSRSPDVLAVGEDIFDALEGTSFAAPQVAGLASYLWMLSPELESRPASVTKQAIVANTRNKVIDAYASVLSLDAAAPPTPDNALVRKTLLDVDGNGAFDENDIDAFLRHFFVVAPDGTITRQAAPGTTADFSRYDLNGDGFITAGARRERFDLDRVGSTQFGQTAYSTVSQTIEGQEIHFDETALTDLEILCYYAYSAMYQGNPDTRKNLLAGRCGLSVQPSTATVNRGQQQQFTATTPNNDSVTWSVTPGCGTIDQNGVFTAASAGTCTVNATDNSDSSQVGTATVIVQGNAKIALISRTCSAEALGVSFFNLQTLLDPGFKQCSPFPPPPYLAPAVTINNSVSVYSYSANYSENLSTTEISSGSISQGTLDAVAEVDVPAIDISQIPTNPNGVRTIAQGSVTFSIQDSGAYLLTINGTITSTNCCNTATSLILSYDNGAVVNAIKPFAAGLQCDFDNGTCSFTVTQLMNTVDANGEALPSSVGVFLNADTGFTTAGVIQNGQTNQARKGEVKLTFTFQKQ